MLVPPPEVIVQIEPMGATIAATAVAQAVFKRHMNGGVARESAAMVPVEFSLRSSTVINLTYSHCGVCSPTRSHP